MVQALSGKKTDMIFNLCRRWKENVPCGGKRNRDFKRRKEQRSAAHIISVCDRELKDKKCVYVPSEPVLFDDSLLENISMGGRIEDVKMNGILEKTALVEDVKTFENGLLKRCGKRERTCPVGREKESGSHGDFIRMRMCCFWMVWRIGWILQRQDFWWSMFWKNFRDWW